MLFHHINNNNNYVKKVVLDKTTLNLEPHVNFLGVEIDENLTWNYHFESITKKLSTVCYMLRELKKVVNLETLLSCYYGHFFSILKYGIMFWGNSDNNQVFVMQKRAMRIIAGLKMTDSCRGVFKKYNILTKTGLYIYECLCFHQQHKNYFQKALISESCTRKTEIYRYPRHRTTLFENSCYYQSLKLYNSLPQNYRAMQLSVFKKQVKHKLVKAELYTLKEFSRIIFI